jgi:hypothetical protein
MTNIPYQPSVILRSAVLPAGYSDGYLRRARRSGAIVTLLPGVYVNSADLPDLALLEWHLAMVGAAVGKLTGEPVVSHLSAAVLHGIGPVRAVQQPIHVTRRPPAKSRRGGRIVVHRAELAADDIVRMSGVPVTTAARTALDCAFLLPPDAAAAVVRAGCADGRFTPDELLGRLAGYRRVPGVRRVAGIVQNAGGSGHYPTVINT